MYSIRFLSSVSIIVPINYVYEIVRINEYNYHIVKAYIFPSSALKEVPYNIAIAIENEKLSGATYIHYYRIIIKINSNSYVLMAFFIHVVDVVVTNKTKTALLCNHHYRIYTSHRTYISSGSC